MEELCWKAKAWLSDFNNVASLTGQTTTSAIGAAIGAILAFYFGKRMYELSKHREAVDYLQHAVSIVSSVSNSLYVFKKDIVVARKEEADEIALQLKNPPLNEEGIWNPKIREMSQFIQHGGFAWPVSQEKLHFLASKCPNLTVLLETAFSSVRTLNVIVSDVNKSLDRAREIVMNEEELRLLTIQTDNLAQQTDSTLYLIEKSTDLLIEFGKREFKKEMKISKISVDREDYKKLKPPVIESWEDVEWFIKKPWYKRIFS